MNGGDQFQELAKGVKFFSVSHIRALQRPRGKYDDVVPSVWPPQKRSASGNLIGGGFAW